jgi:hypothetical protein
MSNVYVLNDNPRRGDERKILEELRMPYTPKPVTPTRPELKLLEPPCAADLDEKPRFDNGPC